jgi:hypothetical protein
VKKDGGDTNVKVKNNKAIPCETLKVNLLDSSGKSCKINSKKKAEPKNREIYSK